MIISRYLIREVINALLAVTIVLLLAFLSQQIVRYLNYVAVGKIPTNIFLALVSFEVPYLLAILLPLSLYLGILLAYGRLYSDNEMAIMQMCGFGKRHLTRLTMIIALAVSGIVLFLMLWINPWISAKREQIMSSDEATIQLVQSIIPGRFQASPDGKYVMYVERLSRDRSRAENVFLAQEKRGPDDTVDQSAWTLVAADQGYQMKDKVTQDQFFVTANGYRYEGTPGQNNYKITQFKKYSVRIPQNDMHSNHKEDETLSTLQLWQNYADPKSAAELQWRVSIPILAFLLALLAVPMSAVRPRQGRYLAFIPAVLVYIVYINLLFMARHWMEMGAISSAIGMWWVHGLMFIFVMAILYVNSKK